MTQPIKVLDSKYAEIFLIPFATISFYLFTYFYEFGVAKSLSIPYQMISISLPIIIGDLTSNLGILSISAIFIYSAFYYGLKSNLRFFLFLLICFIFTLIYSSGLNLDGILNSLAASLFLCLGIRLLNEHWRDDKHKILTLFTCVVMIYGYFFIALEMQGEEIYTPNSESMLSGRMYSFDKGGKEYMILRVYGDLVFAKELVKGKENTPTFLFKDDDLSNIKLKEYIKS